ncbi:hypothetical protein [Streptomyces sp. NRRL B-1347]|uniref:hypothetical protein n=1 Tax=Streptomyces sp. NRRL B-1347 TaxID=1476877 RepID=UPI0004C6F6E4|nr:hypothetical protein [Streptomyces sp. NRRL B-1347]
MHHHGYLWAGPKARLDDEALRRPAHPDPPPAGNRPELIHRHREVVAEFPRVDLPPLETAYWLIKPADLIRGTWQQSQGAAGWLSGQLAAHAPRFATSADRDPRRLEALSRSAAERLARGHDVSLGFYLERPTFLSLALVCCTPNHAKPHLPCPLR